MQAKHTCVKDVLLRLSRFMLPACASLPLTYVVPKLNPFKPPHFDLTGWPALAAYGATESGSTLAIPVIAAVMIALLVNRTGNSWRRQIVEAWAMVLVVATFLGGGAYLNEHAVKPRFGVARPNIVELAATPPDAPALKTSVEAFYNLPDKASRSAYLADVLGAKDFHAVELHARIREHWIAETGYSFPSGHSFCAMMFATFFLAMGLTFFSRRRLWVFYLLVPWAVMVCYSRPILRVHSPTDICIGGLAGVVVGIVAFLVARSILAAGPVGQGLP